MEKADVYDIFNGECLGKEPEICNGELPANPLEVFDKAKELPRSEDATKCIALLYNDRGAKLDFDFISNNLTYAESIKLLELAKLKIFRMWHE